MTLRDPRTCPHEDCQELDAVAIERFRCRQCGALVYRELKAARDGNPKKHLYRCSYTAWRPDSVTGKQRRQRCCREVPTEWYNEAAYCEKHKPQSRFAEDERAWRGIVAAKNRQVADYLAAFDRETAALREQFAPKHKTHGVGGLTAVGAAPDSVVSPASVKEDGQDSLDWREFTW